MPLNWDPHRNPFAENDFRVLHAGPGILPTQIVQLAGNLKRQIESGHDVQLNDREVTVAQLQEASNRLREPETLAEELLLAHWPPKTESPPIDGSEFLKQILSAVCPVDDSQHASGILGRPGDDADRLLDILFDE